MCKKLWKIKEVLDDLNKEARNQDSPNSEFCRLVEQWNIGSYVKIATLEYVNFVDCVTFMSSVHKFNPHIQHINY